MKEVAKNEVVEIGGRELTLTNLNKVFWPEEAVTKGDMIAYYRRVAPILLSYLKDRPEILHRFPNGIGGKGFFQKDVGGAPHWVETVRVESESGGDPVDYLVCQDEAALVYMVNLGSIEINPWNSRTGSLDKPDYLVVDLDPEGRTFEEVIAVALAYHQVLDEIRAPGLVKTSGQSGLHIFVPLGAQYSYEQARQFALLLAQLVNESLPELTSLERSPKKRQGKIYLDYLQNAIGQTMAAPYSLRPRPGAPVSTPLQWEEVRPGLSPHKFNIKTIPARLDDVGDLWQAVLGPGIDMQHSLELLQAKWSQLIQEIEPD